MDTLEGMRPWARDALADVAPHFQANADAAAELRAAGVAQHTIDALYPFDIRDWTKAVSTFSVSKEVHRADAQMLVPSLSILKDLSRVLKPATQSARLAEFMLDELSFSDRVPSTRPARVLITGLLLDALSDDQQEIEISFRRAWVSAARNFKNSTDEFYRALALTPDTFLPWEVNS